MFNVDVGADDGVIFDDGIGPKAGAGTDLCRRINKRLTSYPTQRPAERRVAVRQSDRGPSLVVEGQCFVYGSEVARLIAHVVPIARVNVGEKRGFLGDARHIPLGDHVKSATFR